LRDLPDSLDGFTLVLLSDIHLRPYTQPETVRRAVALANQLKPDLVVITGDHVWTELEAVYELTPILASLNARHGVYAAMGNHEHWTDPQVIATAFRQAGLPMLVNQGVPIQTGLGSLYLAGLDDGWSGKPDLDQALADRPAGAPVVLLFHEPDLVDEIAQDGRVALQLSGHTHGGQVRIAGKTPPIHPYLGENYVTGLFRVQDTWLYVNRGIGTISVPVRINCPPEVTHMTLVQA
jgi:uncharacterized protein